MEKDDVALKNKFIRTVFGCYVDTRDEDKCDNSEDIPITIVVQSPLFDTNHNEIIKGLKWLLADLVSHNHISFQELQQAIKFSKEEIKRNANSDS